MKNILAAFAALTCVFSAADAAIDAKLEQIGANVLLSYTGSIDLSGYRQTPSGRFDRNNALVRPDNSFGVRNGEYQFWDVSVVGPANFGGGTQTSTINVSGDTFFFNFSTERIGVATNYTSGSMIAGGALFQSITLAALGATPGSYLWTLTNGDTISLTVGDVADPVPLPLPAVLFASGLAAFGALRRKAAR
ncbi:MAG: hypothetical protein HRU11_11850 [Parvularculaceae bacterium]|nr:hypothetical protein [Parvularculaceae bacterium]